MEKRVLSRINPYVSAGCSVHCSFCASEVKPAMSIERGYAVEAVSLVEPLNYTNGCNEGKPLFTFNFNGVAGKKTINSETEVKTILPVNNVAENIVEVDDKAKAITQVNDVIEDDTFTVEGNVTLPIDETEGNDSDTPSDETVLQKNSSGDESIVQKNSSDDESIAQVNTGEGELEVKKNSHEDEAIVQKDNSDEESENPNENQSEDDETEWKDSDKVQEIYIVSSSKYKGINLALDKARLCLQKTNSTTLKRAQELSGEGITHVEAIKKLVEENIPKQGSTLIDDLGFISKELFKNLEDLKYKMLDCQLENLLETVDTLKQDLVTEMADLDKEDQSGEVMANDFEIATPTTDPMMGFLKDAPWVFFGFISILAANLGFFSQPWLFQSFHTSVVGYLKNATFW